MEEENTHILEIILISAQSLKNPITNLRRMQTYALLWVDSSNKLRTKIDHFGSENPTWNNKFLFRVSRKFISGNTSSVSVEIYAVGILKYFLFGTVLGNAKGAVAVVISILIFRNPVSVTGMLGYALTVFGVILYSEAKKRSKH